MNKFRIVFMLMILSLCVFAEYQVFSYKATYYRLNPSYKKIDGTICRVNGVVTERQTGYLVTVCCYPCGCDFGSGYPTWLFVQNSRDDNGTVYKIQVSCEGGLFGDYISMYHVKDMSDYLLTEHDKTLLKKTTKSWFRMHLDEKEQSVKYVKVPNYAGYTMSNHNCNGDAGLPYFAFGCEGEYAEVDFAGFGNAGWKVNDALKSSYCDFNMYIKSVSGQLVGVCYTDGEQTYDPSNYYLKSRVPINGNFSIVFNKKMTELIRGTSDWNVITNRILNQMEYDSVITEEYDENKLWLYQYEEKPEF